MKKRVLSVLMALTLVLGLIPAAMPHAHAEEHTCRDDLCTKFVDSHSVFLLLYVVLNKL